MIKFSVHVPVYNVEKYLAICVDSILNQTYKDFEVILVDDGSTDGSGKICDLYACKDKRVRVYHNSNQGLLLTRRFSIAKSEGKYSIFIDSDDYVKETLLEELSKKIEKYSADIIVYNYAKDCEGVQKENDPIWDSETIFKSKNEKQQFYEKFFFTLKLNNIWLKAVKTELLLADTTDYNNLSFVKNSEDLLQSIFPILNANTIVYLPQILYFYRKNENSITNTFDINRFKSIISVREISYYYIREYNLFDSVKLQIYFTNLFAVLVNMAYEIAIQSLSSDSRINILKQMLMNDFVSNEVINRINFNCLDFKHRIMGYLLCEKKYKSFVFISKIYNLVHSIIRGE